MKDISVEATIDYTEIPHFPSVSAMGHRGQLVCGSLEGVPVVAFQGRFHLYEGHNAQQVSLPVRLMRALGANVLLVSNAAGGAFQAGQVPLRARIVLGDQIGIGKKVPVNCKSF